jgi:hypothetical protein
MHPSTAVVPPRRANHRGPLPRAAWLAGGVMALTLVALAYSVATSQQPAQAPEAAEGTASAPAPERAAVPVGAVNAPLAAPARKPPPVAGERRASEGQPPATPGRKPPPVQGGRPPGGAVSV